MTLKDVLINIAFISFAGTCAWYLKPPTKQQSQAPTYTASVLPIASEAVPEVNSQKIQIPIQEDQTNGLLKDKNEKAKRIKEARDIIWEMSNADAKAAAMISKTNSIANPAYAGNKQAIADVRNSWVEAIQACDKALESAESIANNSLFDSSAHDYAQAYKTLTYRRKEIKDAQFRVLDYIENLQPGELNLPGYARTESQRLFIEFGKKLDETRKAQGQAFRILNNLKLSEN